jgi:sialate O-acetylesterase
LVHRPKKTRIKKNQELKIMNKEYVLRKFIPLIIVFAAAGFLLASGHAAAAEVRDIEGHPAQQLIEIWLSEGLASGYSDGTFRPDQPVSRAEFAAFIGKVFELPERSDIVYADTPPDSWYLADVQRLHAAGAISGFPDGTFRPDQHITRQEAAAILYKLRSAGRSPVSPASPVRIPDLALAESWSQPAIAGLAEAGYIAHDENFRPLEPLTRADLVVWLDRFYTEREKIRPADVKSLFTEQFQVKQIKNRQVVDSQGNVVWRINKTPEQTHAITGGALELGGAQYMQLASPVGFDPEAMDSYAIEFTINLQRMSNVGHSGRPMAVIIPRSKDAKYKQFYAVTYYMETTYIGNIVANLFKTKWAIVNTAAPSGMSPLVEGYYMLRENVDYTARLVIENAPDGSVNIAFYIDGPTDPASSYTPIVSYQDRSPYRIKKSAAGPAFGMVGRADDFWGLPPTVQYDDVRIMSIAEYKNWEKWLKRYSAARPTDLADHPLRKELKYLVNRGLLEVQAGNKLYPDQYIKAPEFAAMLETWNGTQLPAQPDSFLRKKQAAEIIYQFLGKPKTDLRYKEILAEGSNRKPDEAVHYAFEKGILGLEASGRFEPDRFVTRAEAALMLLRVMDEGYRLPHGSIKIPSILSSGAVLQRDKPIPIWGTGTSGDTITVRFRKQVKQTTVVNGQWSVVLDPEPYGGPDRLTVTGTAEEVVLNDILVGEVFIVAGQSNAEMSIEEVNDTEDIYAKYSIDEDTDPGEIFTKYADIPKLRYYFADQVMAVKPRFDDGGAWYPSYPWAIGYSSAIGTFFVDKLLELNEELRDVPIGVIRITYGGSTIELFLPDTFFASIGYEQQHDEPIMSGYWNGFMHTVAPFAAKAVLYYQGENSTQLGYAYESLLRALIQSWREEFRDPNLPFFLVQLAGYGENYYETDIDSWPVIREIQMRVANTVPNTQLVTAVDLADPDPLEIHPRDKRPIGERLAYRAMETLYGDRSHRNERSPEMSGYRLENGTYTISFDYITDRLVLNSYREIGESGFEILDGQGRWVPAHAKLSGDRRQVTVWRPGEPEPQGVRYAWRNYPSVTLFDASGLPVLPFNSTKDVKHDPPVMGTDQHYIRIRHHLLKSYDAIVNLSRGNQFRMVEAVDGHQLWHQFAIEGQSPGDEILLLSRLDNGLTESGTNETIIHMRNHGLKEGDWIRNNSRGWIPSRVLRVIDKNSFEIADPIPGQTAGDELERYARKRAVQALGLDE